MNVSLFKSLVLGVALGMTLPAVANAATTSIPFSENFENYVDYPTVDARAPWSGDAQIAWFAACASNKGMTLVGGYGQYASLDFPALVSSNPLYVDFNLAWSLMNGFSPGFVQEVFHFNGVRLGYLSGHLYAWDEGLGWISAAPIYDTEYGIAGRSWMRFTIRYGETSYSLHEDGQGVLGGLRYAARGPGYTELRFSSMPVSDAHMLVDNFQVSYAAPSGVLLSDEAVPSLPYYDDFSGMYGVLFSNAGGWHQLRPEPGTDAFSTGFYVVTWPLGTERCKGVVLQVGGGNGAVKHFGTLPERVECSFWALRWGDGPAQSLSCAENVFFDFAGVRLALTDGVYARDGVTGSWSIVSSVEGDGKWCDYTLDTESGWGKVTVRLNQATGLYTVQVGDGPESLARQLGPERGSAAWMRFCSGLGNWDTLMIDDVEVKVRTGYDALIDGAPVDPDDRTWDSDNDGIPDFWERLLGGDLYVADADTLKFYGGYETTLRIRYELLLNGGVDFVTGLTMAQLLGEASGGDRQAIPFRLNFARDGLEKWEITDGTVRPRLEGAWRGDSFLEEFIAGTTVLELSGQGGRTSLPVAALSDESLRITFSINWDGGLGNTGNSKADLDSKVVFQFNGMKLAVGEMPAYSIDAYLYAWNEGNGSWEKLDDICISNDVNYWSKIEIICHPAQGVYSVGPSGLSGPSMSFIPENNPQLEYCTLSGGTYQVTDICVDFLNSSDEPATLPYEEDFDEFWSFEPVENGFHGWSAEYSNNGYSYVYTGPDGRGSRSLSVVNYRPYGQAQPDMPAVAWRSFGTEVGQTPYMSMEFWVQGWYDFADWSNPVGTEDLPTTTFLSFNGVKLGWGSEGLHVLRFMAEGSSIEGAF
jgi:hypothetical protein